MLLKKDLSTGLYVENDVYLAAGQVQGSVPVLIKQGQVGLGSMKENGWATTKTHIFINH